MKLNQAVSLRLAELMQARAMTQYQLSTKSGVPKSSIGNIMHCAYDSVKLRVLHELCQGLSISLPEFFDSIARRIRELCRQRGITPNGLATTSAVPQATIKSILNGESKNPGAVTIKKLCDGFEITLGEFFSTPEFDALEQEIK